MLKIGRKKLFLLNQDQRTKECAPLCVLDFYIHESRQRRGYGRRLFDYMLRVLDVSVIFVFCKVKSLNLYLLTFVLWRVTIFLLLFRCSVDFLCRFSFMACTFFSLNKKHLVIAFSQWMVQPYCLAIRYRIPCVESEKVELWYFVYIVYCMVHTLYTIYGIGSLIW